MMHEILENMDFDVATPSANYATVAAGNNATSEVDIEDAQNIVMLVEAGTCGGTITVQLHGASSSGGDFAVMDDVDGDDASVSLTEAGLGQVEVRAADLKRYVKPVVTAVDTSGGADIFDVTIVSGNYETAPIS